MPTGSGLADVSRGGGVRIPHASGTTETGPDDEAKIGRRFASPDYPHLAWHVLPRLATEVVCDLRGPKSVANGLRARVFGDRYHRGADAAHVFLYRLRTLAGRARGKHIDYGDEDQP